MYQGETVTTTLTSFPDKVENITNLHIIYRNRTKKILDLTLDDVSIDTTNQYILYTLTQAQSLSLPAGDIQRDVVILTNAGNRYEYKLSTITVLPTPILNVMSDTIS